MGTSTTAAEFTGKIEKLAKELSDTRRPLNVTALQAKRVMQVSAGGLIGAKPQGKRKRISVGYEVKGQGMEASAIVGYRGPAHLVNNPTRAHEILPRRRPGVRSRRRGARALAINGDLRAVAHHLGTRGKHFYEKARAIIRQQAPRTYAKAGLSDPLRKVF
jgi:hypothetical protein